MITKQGFLNRKRDIIVQYVKDSLDRINGAILGKTSLPISVSVPYRDDEATKALIEELKGGGWEVDYSIKGGMLAVSLS